MALRRLFPLLVSAALLVGCGSSTGPTTGAPTSASPGTASGSTVVDDGLVPIGEGLRGPSGVKATVYATGLANVAAFAFDAHGHLWAATADFEDKGNDAVYVIPGAGAAPIKVLADVHTPLGLLWHGDSLYVSSKERVDTFTGFDGKAFASSKAILELPEGVGEVNGLALGPDGRIRLGISAPCDSCTPTLEQSASVLSFLPDGGDVQVEARGIRAPIGLAYFPGTDDLFATMNQQDSLGDATPGDWLSIVEPGQNWRFPQCYGQGGDACNGVPAPVAELDKHAAVIGLAIVTGELGPTVGTSALVAEWASGKVQQVTLEHDGATYKGTVHPFVTGIEKPVPLALAPDRSLLVGDWSTGTIYRIATA